MNFMVRIGQEGCSRMLNNNYAQKFWRPFRPTVRWSNHILKTRLTCYTIHGFPESFIIWAREFCQYTFVCDLNI